MKAKIVKRTLSQITVLALAFTLAVREPVRFSQPMSTNTPMYMSTAFSAGAQTRESTTRSPTGARHHARSWTS